jgi:hypothetical protein
MQIDGRDRGGTERQATFLMLALEPPGNIARDLALYRRALFADTGDSSCFLLPEIVPISFARRESVHRATVDGDRRAFDDAWKIAQGGFSSASFIESRGLLYLGLDGPLDALTSVSQGIISSSISTPPDDAPLETGLGFFFCRRSPSANGSIQRRRAPQISFFDCSLVLLSIRFGVDPFSSASWREIARSRRPTGPRSRPGLISSSLG